MYLEPCQTSKRKLFAEIVTGLQRLTNFPKSSILDVWQGSESISVGCLTYFTASLISLKWWWRLKYTAWRISEFGEFLVCFSSYSDWIFILNNFISTPVFHFFFCYLALIRSRYYRYIFYKYQLLTLLCHIKRKLINK